MDSPFPVFDANPAVHGPFGRALIRRALTFWPHPGLWRNAEDLTIRPVFFVRTLRDRLALIAVIPVMERIQRL